MCCHLSPKQKIPTILGNPMRGNTSTAGGTNTAAVCHPQGLKSKLVASPHKQTKQLHLRIFRQVEQQTRMAHTQIAKGSAMLASQTLMKWPGEVMPG